MPRIPRTRDQGVSEARRCRRQRIAVRGDHTGHGETAYAAITIICGINSAHATAQALPQLRRAHACVCIATHHQRVVMHRESVHRARRVVLCTALLVSWAPSSYAVDGMLYARAIGDPLLSQPAVDAPPPPPRATNRGIPDLPALGTAPPTDNAPTPAPVSDGWSWKRVLVGVGVVVAISALASKGGGGAGSSSGDSSAAIPSPPPSGGGGSSGGSSGGGVASPTPAPAPTPAPPTTGGGGGGNSRDDDDDDDKKKDNRGRRILIPSFSASF